jgi:small subunit ribosomal protein S26e
MVDASSQRDLRDASVYSTFMMPKIYMKMLYCVSCAIHGRVVRVRRKTLRDSPAGRVYVRPTFGKGGGKGK